MVRNIWWSLFTLHKVVILYLLEFYMHKTHVTVVDVGRPILIPGMSDKAFQKVQICSIYLFDIFT